MFFVGLYEKGTSETTSSHITNTYVPEMTSVQAEKVWNDDSDRDGLRPDSITLQLYKTVNGNTTAVGAPVTVTASDNWTYQFENLHKYEDGEEIVYTVKEESVPSGYTASVETDPHNTGVIIVTNTHVPNKVSVSASKEWDDDNNRDNIRPSELTFALYANGVKVDGSEKIVNAANNWSAEWTDLNQNSAGNPIRYTVREENVPNGYTVSYSTVSSNNYLITNTRTEYAVTDISVNKIWNDSNNQDGVRPESIKIHLLANGTVIDSRIVTAKDNWTWNFTDLDKYVNGTQILYTITEDPVEGYTTKINGYNVINTHVPENDDVSVTKVWHDDDNFSRQRPDSITVHLYANGTRIATQVITAADNWTWTFTNLDKYDENGLITYTVSEDPVENYVASVYVIEEGELVIINKYQPKPVTHDEPITPPDTSDTSITALILALASIFLGGLTLKRKKDNA